jgi:hypothetical protein
MTTDSHQTRCALVDLVIPVPEIVCLAPNWTHVPTTSPRVRAPQTPRVPPLNNTPSHQIRSPQHRGTWLVAP